MKGVLAPPFYRAEKPLSVRRTEAKNVYLTRDTHALRTENYLGLSDNLSVSPIGRRSGAHLNPAVSVAFWRRGHMHKHDVIGYLTAQATGAVAGTAAAGALWDRRSTALDLGVSSQATA